MTDDVPYKDDMFLTRFWEEEAEPDNPFAARTCYCYGYDVYGDVLEKASWVEYLYLLFKGERPSTIQAKLLEKLAIAITNPGPRDHSVRAGMDGAVGKANSAGSLMAALSVAAGQLGGAREVYIGIQYWQQCGHDLQKWQERFIQCQPRCQGELADEVCNHDPLPSERIDSWVPIEHPPGFDPHGVSCPQPVLQVLEYLAKLSTELSPEISNLQWLAENRSALEQFAHCPLAMNGVAAAAFVDLEFDHEQAEMLCLILRLPGIAAHAIERREYDLTRYPFFKKGMTLADYEEN